MDALKMPIAYTSNSFMHSMICPDRNGRLKINHNSNFKFTCETGKFVSGTLRSSREVNVKCLKGDSIEYRGRTYAFKDFKCDAVPKSKLKATKANCQNSIYEFYNSLNLPGILYVMVYNQHIYYLYYVIFVFIGKRLGFYVLHSEHSMYIIYYLYLYLFIVFNKYVNIINLNKTH